MSVLSPLAHEGLAVEPPSPLSFAILGCGARGRCFSEWIAGHPEAARVVAVADPHRQRRDAIGDLHGVPSEMRFTSWTEVLARPKLADAVINTLMDRLHAPSSLQALGLGYHMLLEKPMAVTLEDCAAIDAARRRNGSIVTICHSLRYHPTYRHVKQLLDEGVIGRIASIDQLEGVDPVHQAHSFVRGNWGNESRSAFMLLTKSCHDIDILMYLVGRDCVRVSSFGGLAHFTRENRPAGAPDRCSDGCPHEADCPYSAMKVYGPGTGCWARYIGLDRLSQAERDEFLRFSPYGRCVYAADNDVVDHQVVNFEFEGGATGTFTMTAFAPSGRRLRIHGTHGYLSVDVDHHQIELHRFWGSSAGRQCIEVPAEAGSHGGGDDIVMECLIRAIRENDPSLVLTDTEESLRTHAVAFAAETARRERRVVEVAELGGDSQGRAYHDSVLRVTP